MYLSTEDLGQEELSMMKTQIWESGFTTLSLMPEINT